MDNHDLLAIIGAYRQDSYGADDSDLTDARAEALDRYNGRLYGDEKDGHSQVVSMDLREVVDWIKPALIKIFTQSGNIVEFSPIGEEDEKQAEQESDAVNHVIMVENNGVILLHDLFHDGLLLKNAYCKHYIAEEEKIIEDEYSGMSSDELVILMAELEAKGEVEVLEQDVEIVPTPVEGGFVEMESYSVRVRITSTEKIRVVEAIPSEEVRVSKRCKGSLQDSPFVEHVTTKTRTELLEMGMDEEFVWGLAAYTTDKSETQSNARDTVADEYDATTGYNDRSMDEIQYCEAYIRVDFDGDKKAELRKVVTCANQIPPGKEWNEVVECVSITSLSPKRVPHRHIGEGLNDDLGDLAKILTVLKRQLLDNVYRTNSSEKVINNRVDQDDAYRSIPGNVIQVDDDLPVTGAVEYSRPPSIIADILPVIQLIESDRDSRTGVNETTTNMNPDALKEINNKVFLEGMAKASQKVELIARMFAEGIKEIGYRVHEMMIKHQDKPMTIRLRGDYVSINPQEWKNRTDMRIRVGLGTGTEEEKRMKLAAVSTEQERMAGAGLVGPQQAFNLFEDMVEALQVGQPERYVLRPGSDEHKAFMQQQAQQKESNPLAEAEQVKGQANMAISQAKEQSRQQIEAFKEQSKQQMEAFREQHKHEMELYKSQVEAANNEADRRSKEAISIMTQEVKALIEGYKIDMGQTGIGGEFSE